VGRIVERLLMRNLRLRQLKYWPKGARSDMVEQEFEAKFPGHNSPGLSSCSDCGPEEENMAKTEAAENNGRSWALFQKRLGSKPILPPSSCVSSSKLFSLSEFRFVALCLCVLSSISSQVVQRPGSPFLIWLEEVFLAHLPPGLL